ncbi:hypothetical protein TSHO111613_13400 [Tsukamurella hominis]
MTPAELRAVVLSLPARQPITDEYERWPTPSNTWYEHQQQHLDGWLNEYNTPGAYRRTRLDGDARDFYQHFRCVAGLLWLAEALGIDQALLRDAIVDVIAAGANPSSQCGAFRRRVPWTMVEPLAAEQLAALPRRRGVASRILRRGHADA